MKRGLLLLLIVIILATTASVALAKPGKHMDLVCWVNTQGKEQWAYFMTTGSGIVQRFKLDGKHDIYKPVSNYGDMPDASGWTLHTGKEQAPCTTPTAFSYNDFVEDGVVYWHRYNK